MVFDSSINPRVWRDLRHFLAFGFGSGLARRAPGTWGTLAAVPCFLLLCHLPLWQYGLMLLVALLAGIWLCGSVAEDLGVHDHGGIVWDELLGFWLTMLLVPVSWQTVLAGFVLFRLFDVIKPWPIRWLDRHVHGGFGIMIDDVIAALFANLVLQSLRWQGWL